MIMMMFNKKEIRLFVLIFCGILITNNWALAQKVSIKNNLPSTLIPYHGKCRIAISSDGNQHDHDDWGATSSFLAIIAAKGAQAKLVHYDYCDHLGNNSISMEKKETVSALEGADRFGFNLSQFFNDQSHLKRSIANLTKAINKSTKENPLIMLLAGPMEVPYRAIAAADKSKLKYVYCVSHSHWNNKHINPPEMTHTAKDIQALGVNWVQITDQNGGFFTQKNHHNNWKVWNWMENSSNANYRWIYRRMRVEGKPDISDAGMAFYLFTGNQHGTARDLEKYLGSK